MSITQALRARADLLAYVPAAVTTTVTAATGHHRPHLVSKLSLAPTLAAGVLATRSQRPTSRTATLVTALTGSLVGDWFMYRSGRSEGEESRAHMRRGATSFAVQQAGLIRLLLGDGARPLPRSTAAAAGVMAALAVLDSDGGLPDPVLGGYGALLGSMSALAMSEGEASPARRGVAIGGALFLLSDAAIIVGEHYATTPRAQAISSAVILSTYTAALALLVHGLRDHRPIVTVG